MKLAPMKFRKGRPLKYTDEIVNELGRRIEAGQTYKHVSEIMGISYPVVIQLYRYRYLGHPKPTPKREKLDIEPPEEDKGDPRSPVCRRIKLCSHDRCYLHSQCPAYQAWAQRHLKVA